MYYEGGKPQPPSHQIISFGKEIAKDMPGFTSFTFYFFLLL